MGSDGTGVGQSGSIEDDLRGDNPALKDPDTEFRPAVNLSEEEAETQADSLREAIRFHDYRCYVRNDPVISDRAYDQLFARLETLETTFDIRAERSPTRRVGGEPVEELGTAEHVVALLSIDSSGDANDVREFAQRVESAVDGPVRLRAEI
jgi:DNA ligase (NAD+)